MISTYTVGEIEKVIVSGLSFFRGSKRTKFIDFLSKESDFEDVNSDMTSL